MRELHAWENGHHVGVFSEDDEERISFAYDANEGLPISLSLPRTGGWRDQAPRNFLDNLLPDNPNVRQAMREHLNASSAGVFDLLDRVDATGGLVFSLSPEPPIPSPTLRQFHGRAPIRRRIAPHRFHQSSYRRHAPPCRARGRRIIV